MVKLVYTTDPVPVEERLGWFHRIWSEKCAIYLPEHVGRDFQTTTNVYPIGDFVLFDATYTPFLGNRPGDQLDIEQPGFSVAVVTKGEGQIAVGETSRRFKAGDVIFYDRYDRFHFNASTNYSQIVASMCYSNVGVEPGRTVDLHVLPERDPRAKMLSFNIKTLQAAANRDPMPLVALLAKGFEHMVAAFLNPDKHAHDSAARAYLKRESILRYIDENLGDPTLGPDHLAKEFGVSRAVLYRMFNELDGISNHIRNRRLDASYAYLVNSESRAGAVGQVAEAFTFYDQAHFTNRFKERYGFRPKEIADFGKVGKPGSRSEEKAIQGKPDYETILRASRHMPTERTLN